MTTIRIEISAESDRATFERSPIDARRMDEHPLSQAREAFELMVEEVRAWFDLRTGRQGGRP